MGLLVTLPPFPVVYENKDENQSFFSCTFKVSLNRLVFSCI